MKFIDVVGKTIESAIAEGIAQLNTSEDNVEVTILKQPGMFSKAKVRLTLINEDSISNVSEEKIEDNSNNIEKEKEENLSEKVENHDAEKQDEVLKETIFVSEDKISGVVALNKICNLLNLTLTKKPSKNNRVIIYEVDGENSDLLIGKNGETLDCLMVVLNAINRHNNQEFKHIVIRIPKLEKMKEEKLKKIALDSANKALEINNTVRLDVMNSYERRIVHAYLQEDERVITESFGVEPYRYITVRPKDKEE